MVYSFIFSSIYASLRAFVKTRIYMLVNSAPFPNSRSLQAAERASCADATEITSHKS